MPGSVRVDRLYHRWRRAIAGDVDHGGVLTRIVAENAFTPRYAFMILMSSGIAVLGLLLSSPAVVIGAMLISPLMNPILGLGFGLAVLDTAEMRRSLLALIGGAGLAVLFAAAVVTLSPLKGVTTEILSRTRPNLFDLLVALFAALAGSFAIIRGRGETITGVAIATALMPPLAVVGYGLATWNLPVLGGSLALFFTNLITIALTATGMARLYGFGRRLSGHQNWLQIGLLVGVFVAMAAPLAVSLARIGREAFVITEIKAFLAARFGPNARVSQFDVAFDDHPIDVRAVVIVARAHTQPAEALQRDLSQKLGQPVTLQLDQLLTSATGGGLEAQRSALLKDRAQADREAKAQSIATLVSGAAGAPLSAVTVDPQRRRAAAQSADLPGADLQTYRAVEDRAQAAAGGWSIALTPPLQPLPAIRFARNQDQLDPAAAADIAAAAWAAKRWNLAAIGVGGLPTDTAPRARPTLDQRRALLVAARLRAAGIDVRTAPGGGRVVRLSVAARTAP